MEYNNKELKDSIHIYIKKKFNLNDYIANSIVQEAKGILSSSKELNKEYKSNYKEKIKSIEKKLKEKEKRLEKLKITLLDLKAIQKNIKEPIEKQNSSLKLRTFAGSNISYNYKNNKDHIKVKNKYYGLYYFEYEYLYKMIKKLKSNISKLKYALNNTKTNLANLDKPKRVCFGGAKFIRDNQKKSNFKELLHDKKYKQITVSGRKDAKCGNFVFKYDGTTISFKTIKGEEIKLNIAFPYLGEELKLALLNKQPICIGYKFKKDRLGRKYLVFSASFDRAFDKRFNTDISTGIVAMDTNFGHFDLTDIDEKGNLLDIKTIYYEITDNKVQNELNLRKALNEVGKYVSSKNKILAMEDLNLQKLKNKCKYQHKSYNKMLHTFPFAKINDFIEYEAFKNEFIVKKVNPSYTSVIGKYKYASSKKLNTHIGASLVIGRRALRFKESKKATEFMQFNDICYHNICHQNIAVPIGITTCITGVSGSGVTLPPTSSSFILPDPPLPIPSLVRITSSTSSSTISNSGTTYFILFRPFFWIQYMQCIYIYPILLSS
jgi:IS605 OrfB family transposase